VNEEHQIALAKGTALFEYTIVDVLGVGGFGITYLALDTHLDKKVVIKEFLPSEIATRDSQTTVVARSINDQESFAWGLERFLLEAKTLAKFNHPNIVKINRFFQANGTAYFVMVFEEGVDLDHYLSSKTMPLSEDELRSIILPILDGLKAIHAQDFLHRDIKPGNIFLRTNGTPMLIDFGSSRYAIGSKTQNITQMVTSGYAPIEQYSTDASKQHASVDIYAIGAVMYKMISGKTPVSAQDRSNAIIHEENDPYIPLKEYGVEGFSERIFDTVDQCLVLQSKLRPQDALALQTLLRDQSVIIEKKRSKSYGVYLLGVVLLLVVGFFMVQNANEETQRQYQALEAQKKQERQDAKERERVEKLRQERMLHTLEEKKKEDRIKKAQQKAKENLAIGWDVNGLDDNGVTLLMTAIYEKNYDATKMFLENGANPNHLVQGTYVALSVLLMSGDFNDVTQLLIDYGADVNWRDKYGATILARVVVDDPKMKLTQVQRLELAKVLLDNGTKDFVYLIENKNQTLLDYTKARQKVEFTALLKQYF
jgi:serine/threonine protein kinase